MGPLDVPHGTTRKQKVCPRCRIGFRAPGHGYCLPCHALNAKEYRATHPMTQAQREMAHARAHLYTYIRRGKVEKGPCETCGATQDLQAIIPNPKLPLAMRWTCKRHKNRISLESA